MATQESAALTERRARFGLPVRDRDNPTLWESIALDPTLEIPDDSRAFQLRNLRRPQRLLLQPTVRLVCRVWIKVIFSIKRLPGLRHLASPDTLTRMTPWFVTQACSVETHELLLRHFVVESQLINFVARNCGSESVHEVGLLPTRAVELGDDHGMNAVVRHDVNMFNLVIDLGEAPDLDLTTRPIGDLDFSMLEIPEFDLAPEARRRFNLDAESALSFIVAALATLMDFATAERALNSLQLDESLLVAIAELTGDDTFRTWTPVKFGNWLATPHDVARDLLWHFMVNEYAHTRLRRMAVSTGHS